MPKDLSAQQVGLQGRPSATDPKVKVLTGRTQFPMSYNFANTYRYGHVQPFYYQHTVGDDNIPLFSEHALRTYTLSSPLQSDVNLNKSYYLVDMKAIYPRNWDIMYVAPNKGDDVPAETRFVTSNLIRSCSLYWQQFKSLILGDLDDSNVINNFFRFVFFAESIFSTGSLLSQFNIHLQDFVQSYADDDADNLHPRTFDFWFDTYFVDILRSQAETFTIEYNGYAYRISNDNDSYFSSESDAYYVPLRRIIEIMRSNPFTVTTVSRQEILTAISALFIDTVDEYPLNFEVIAAYQLGCAQFFTDSSVDYIYSASLYRDAVESLIVDAIEQFPANTSFFTYNGIRKQFDVLSGHHLDFFLAKLEGDSVLLDNSTMWNYFSMLFNHAESLRFGDYFVTGKVNPLAPGDVTVNTEGASVSVIDITRKIQLQRFFNSVNATRQKIGDYARNVLGLSNADDNSYDIPAYLGHKTLPIHGMEVENTSGEQRNANSVTTLLKATNNVHAFDITTKRPGIIIGVMSFDCARMYSKTIDRMHMHMDRYDDYIPQMQFVGDQEIWQRELNHKSPVNGIFAYSLRYMEYKIRTHYVAGGAIENLKSWYFVTDNKDGNPFSEHIDPDYIRSQPSEFDRFYSSLTGYSLGNYFHFIVLNKNYQNITRDMVLAPEPLK